MATNFVFCALSGQAIGSEEKLLERVIGLATELATDGELNDFNLMRVSHWQDGSGPAVVMPIDGPPGWHFHRHELLSRYCLGCQIYL